jgi:tetratricopeptide (TPR) repeat protein
MQDYFDIWSECPTCKQLYQKEILLPLANAFAERTLHFPLNHPGRILSLLLLGRALMANKDFNGAERMFLDVFDLINRSKEDAILSDLRLEIQRFALLQMGILFKSKEDFSSSLAYFVEYRDTFDKQDEKCKYRRADADLRIMGIKHKMGDPADIECTSQTAATYLKCRDNVEDSCDGFQDRVNLALALALEDRFKEALSELSESVRVSRQVLGPEHEMTKSLEVTYAQFRRFVVKRRIMYIVKFIVGSVFWFCLLRFLGFFG